MRVCDWLPPELLADTGFPDGHIWWPQDRHNPVRDSIPFGSRRHEHWPDGGIAYWRADRSVEIVLPGTVEHVLTNILQREGRWYIGASVRNCAVEWSIARRAWRLIWRDDNSLPPDEERGIFHGSDHLRFKPGTA